MTDIAQALATLHFSGGIGESVFLTSPRSVRHTHTSRIPGVSPRTSLFTQATQPLREVAQLPDADREAGWSAIVGDFFQAVVEHLPAHAAQHAMLVCRQWHDSVTNGLTCLRPRGLRLDGITSRSAPLHCSPQPLCPPLTHLLAATSLLCIVKSHATSQPFNITLAPNAVLRISVLNAIHSCRMTALCCLRLACCTSLLCFLIKILNTTQQLCTNCDFTAEAAIHWHYNTFSYCVGQACHCLRSEAHALSERYLRGA